MTVQREAQRAFLETCLFASANENRHTCRGKFYRSCTETGNSQCLTQCCASSVRGVHLKHDEWNLLRSCHVFQLQCRKQQTIMSEPIKSTTLRTIYQHKMMSGHKDTVAGIKSERGSMMACCDYKSTMKIQEDNLQRLPK